MTNLKILRLRLSFGFVVLCAAASFAADEPRLKATLKATSPVSMAYSIDGKSLALGYKTVKLWDVVNDRELMVLKGHDSLVWSLAFSPDGKTLASGCGPTIKLAAPNEKEEESETGVPEIKLWDIATGELHATLSGHTNLVSSLAYCPDGKTLASASHDQTVRLWNIETGKQIGIIKGFSCPVNSVAYSPDGKTLA